MSVKLTGNGLWESSRMMLIQHKETINSSLKKVHKKERPIIHEDELQVFIEVIGMSLGLRESVTVSIYGEYEDREVSGIVTRIDQYKKRFKVEFDEGSFEWIDYDEVVRVVI